MKLLLLAVGALVGYWIGRQVDAWDDYRGHLNVERPTEEDIDWLTEFYRNPVRTTWTPYPQPNPANRPIGGLN